LPYELVFSHTKRCSLVFKREHTTTSQQLRQAGLRRYVDRLSAADLLAARNTKHHSPFDDRAARGVLCGPMALLNEASAGDSANTWLNALTFKCVSPAALTVSPRMSCAAIPSEKRKYVEVAVRPARGRKITQLTYHAGDEITVKYGTAYTRDGYAPAAHHPPSSAA